MTLGYFRKSSLALFWGNAVLTKNCKIKYLQLQGNLEALTLPLCSTLRQFKMAKRKYYEIVSFWDMVILKSKFWLFLVLQKELCRSKKLPSMPFEGENTTSTAIWGFSEVFHEYYGRFKSSDAPKKFRPLFDSKNGSSILTF